jgi:autotransporter-associated beta strand protein
MSRSNLVRSFLVAPTRACFATAVIACCTTLSVSSAATLLTWNIVGGTGASSGSAASAPAAGASGSDITGGGATGNSTSPSNTWNRTFALVADATAAQSASPANYFSWTTTATAGYTITFNGLTVLNLSRTSSGPTAAELWYSTDGTTYTKTGSTFTVGSALASAATALSSTITTTPIVIAGGVSTPTVGYWRLVVYGGTAASRLGIGSADATNDFSMLGTISGGAARDLVWSGGGNGTWNTSAGNTPWTFSSNATRFVSNDNVTIGSAAAITVDAAGVSAGSLAVSNPSGTVSLSGGSLAGTTLAKTGAGTLSLQSANTFTGGVSATGGTLISGNSSALGSLGVVLDTSTLQITDPAVTTLANTLAIANGDATIDTGGNVSVTVSGGISTTGTTGGVGVVKGDTQTFNTLTKTGPGKLTLAANLGTQMTYTTGVGTAGVTTTGGIALQIAGGSMEITGAKTWNLASGVLLDTFDAGGIQTASYNGMVWNGDVLMRGGTIQVNGGNIRGTGTITIGVLGESPVNNTIAQRLNFNSPDITCNVVVTSGHTLTLSAASGGAIGLLGNITGNGTITNTGNGTCNIMPTTPAAFTGNFVVVGKMGLSAQALAAASGVNTGSQATNVLTLDNKSATTGALISAPINGLGSIVKTSDGDVILTGNNTFNGGITLNSAGGILVNSITGLGTGTITSSNAGGKVGISTTGASPLTIPNTLITGTADPLTSYYPVLAFAPGAGKTIVLTGAISGSGQLKISGGGDLDLTSQTSGTNTNTGGIEIGTGRILASGDDNLGTGSINFGTIANSNLVAAGTSGNVTFGNAVTIGATSTTGYTANLDTNGKTVTLSGAISDKAGNVVGGAFTKLGSGELVLSGNLSYSGNTTISAGTLTLRGANAANEASTVSIGSTAFLNLNFAGSDTVAALFINGVQKPAGTYTAANSSGAILGTGSLIVTSGPVVTDTTPPVIALNGSASIAVNWGSSYVDAGATATDNVDTSVSVTTAGTVNTAKPGFYSITYNAVDAASNAATPVTRTVTVSIANSTTIGADGYSPLLRYALGANKPTDTVQAPVTSATSTTLSITAVVRIDDSVLTIGGEAATDLSAINGATGSWGQGGNVTVTDSLDQTGVTSGITKRKVFSVDITGASKKFLRLKATLPPST